MVVQFSRSEWEDINDHDRLCYLLREERLMNKKSLAEMAAELNVSEAEIHAWETALVSPPANKYHHAMTFLGSESTRKASKLWTDLQLKRYFATLQSRRESRQHLANAAYIGYVHRLAA